MTANSKRASKLAIEGANFRVNGATVKNDGGLYDYEFSDRYLARSGTKIYRTVFAYNISAIPSDATVTWLQFQFYEDDGVDLPTEVRLMNSLNGNPQTLYNLIGQGSILSVPIITKGVPIIIPQNPTQSPVKEAVENRALFYGLKAVNEGIGYSPTISLGKFVHGYYSSVAIWYIPGSGKFVFDLFQSWGSIKKIMGSP